MIINKITHRFQSLDQFRTVALHGTSTKNLLAKKFYGNFLRKIHTVTVRRKWTELNWTELNWTHQWPMCERACWYAVFLERVYIQTDVLCRWRHRQVVLHTSRWSETFRGHWHWLSFVTCLAVLYWLTSLSPVDLTTSACCLEFLIFTKCIINTTEPRIQAVAGVGRPYPLYPKASVAPPRGITKRPTNTKLGEKGPWDTSTPWTNFKNPSCCWGRQTVPSIPESQRAST